MKKSKCDITEEINEVDITPMLDVVFILLIFFIVTSTFARQSGIGIFVPEKSPQMSSELSPIVVSVMPLGQIEVNQTTVSKSALSSVIRSLLAESHQRSIVVHIDKRAKLVLLVAVLDRIRLAGHELPIVHTMN